MTSLDGVDFTRIDALLFSLARGEPHPLIALDTFDNVLLCVDENRYWKELFTVLFCDKNLRFLILDGVDIVEDEGLSFWEFLDSLKGLEYLELNNISLSSEQLVNLKNFLIRNKSIKVVKVTGESFLGPKLSCFIDVLRSNSSILKLEVNNFLSVECDLLPLFDILRRRKETRLCFFKTEGEAINGRLLSLQLGGLEGLPDYANLQEILLLRRFSEKGKTKMQKIVKLELYKEKNMPGARRLVGSVSLPSTIGSPAPERLTLLDRRVVSEPVVVTELPGQVEIMFSADDSLEYRDVTDELRAIFGK